MLEAIVNFLNLKLELLNYFEKRHCLSVLVKNDDGLIYPAEYISDGDYDGVDWDKFDGVSYFRLNGEINVDRVDQKYTPKPRVNVSFPLRLVYAVRKYKLTSDDAYSFDRVRASIAKQLEIDDQDLVTQLDADTVEINTSGYVSDAKEIWDEETAETGTFQPKYEVVFGAMDVTVTVTTRVECIPSECDDFETDILRTIDFCKAVNQNRLTDTQVDCLTTWLCGVSDPATIQINGVTYTTAASGSTFNQLIQNSAFTSVGTAANPSIVADSQAQVNGVNTETIPATVTHDQQIHDSAGADVGTAANPSVVSDTTIRNQANDWNDTEVAQGTFTLPYLRVVDSDGSNNDTVDYKPVADGAAFTCTPADYGTRILSMLRREYCMGALCGFSLVYIEDEFEANGSTVIRVRRSSDNAEQDFTPTEITDGTLTTFTGAGDGFIVKFYDQTRNYFELFNTSASQQAQLVDTGVLNTDTQGNPVAITTSTNGYEIGANGSNSSRLTLFSPDGAFWMVGTKNNSTSISRAISAAGNPAVGIADATSNPNDVNTGTPNTYVNGSALADQNRDTLQTAINNVEHILLMTNCEWTDSGGWRTSQGILAFQAYPVGSQMSEFVLGKMDWDTVTLRNLIFTDRNAYYGYY